jgi:predicted amidohydrolase YtcJ
MGIAIAGAQLLDGNGGPPLQDQAVLVEGDQIAAIVPATALDRSSHQVIDVEGRTLLPSLMDSHVHIAGFRTRTTPPSGEPAETAQDVLDVVRGLIALARSGIGAIRD